MGMVYLARHQHLGGWAAIKVLHSQYSQSPQVAERFLNEARAVHQIDHPGLVKIFEFGKMPEGQAFLIMEYLRGESLGRRLHRLGRFPVADALRLSRQIAATLAAVHERRVVHRDLKPDNVVIVSDEEAPGGERPKILDFGIAKVHRRDAGPLQTEDGAQMGTAAYMAPEQGAGAGAVDDRADVYSLGVMIYAMLAGWLPFWDPGSGALIAMHIYQPPPPLPAGIAPPELEKLLLTLLAKQPGSRPSMAALAKALSTHWPDETAGRTPNQSRPEPSPEEAEGQGRVFLSTLRHAAGETGIGPTARRAAGGVALTVGFLGLVAVGFRLGEPSGAGLAAWNADLGRSPEHSGAAVARGPATPGPDRAASPAPVLVTWSIGTTPGQAEVVAGAHGPVLGRTPLTLKRPMLPGKMTLILRLRGYQEQRIEVDQSANFQVERVLRPRPTPIYHGVKPFGDKE